jgi:hypothetical protein
MKLSFTFSTDRRRGENPEYRLARCADASPGRFDAGFFDFGLGVWPNRRPAPQKDHKRKGGYPQPIRQLAVGVPCLPTKIFAIPASPTLRSVTAFASAAAVLSAISASNQASKNMISLPVGG